MSWGLNIVAKDMDGNEHWINVIDSQTGNLRPMWTKAVSFLEVTRDFEGKVCGDILLDLKSGLMDILDHPSDYIALNPTNGWGDFDGFFETYVRLVQQAAKYPSGVLRWNG